ncbi:MAG: hypothetical protein KME49_22715 [Brasilonema octagenarum HA4186-MV1]|jgi:hypothetical protein|nr:hypothetical protein [Brasilonema octagenarum HA4186-MV1]
MKTSKPSLPYKDGEYLVIQTHPIGQTLRLVKRTFDYQEARSTCEIENLANDYSAYDVRIYHDGKLWYFDFNKKLLKPSLEQFWHIQVDYKAASRDLNTDGEIIVHRCSYPYFSSLRTRLNRFGEAVEYWQPLTCLVEDCGNDIENCPNCGAILIALEEYDDEEDEDNSHFSTPQSCQGCRNFHGHIYGDNALICGMHPSGWNEGDCPDYEGISGSEVLDPNTKFC